MDRHSRASNTGSGSGHSSRHSSRNRISPPRASNSSGPPPSHSSGSRYNPPRASPPNSIGPAAGPSHVSGSHPGSRRPSQDSMAITPAPAPYPPAVPHYRPNRPSQGSGSRTTHSDPDSDEARPLFRVVFSGSSRQSFLPHWGLWLPDNNEGAIMGTLFHVGVDEIPGRSRSGMTRGPNHRVRIKRMNPFASRSIKSAHPLPNTRMSRRVLGPVCDAVFEANGAYRAASNNCQHFCLDVVRELNRMYPDPHGHLYVSDIAVQDVAQNGTIFTSEFSVTARQRSKNRCVVM